MAGPSSGRGLFLIKGGNVMDEKKKEEIVVLDEGIDTADMAGPKGICCRGALSPVR
jgi:hypothetical protein